MDMDGSFDPNRNFFDLFYWKFGGIANFLL